LTYSGDTGSLRDLQLAVVAKRTTSKEKDAGRRPIAPRKADGFVLEMFE
jgi:hypothetical protein